nr:hypothetical protein [Streptosporangium amethystogenes]
MKPDLDSLATALYVRSDDLLKQSPQLAPWRPLVCITPKLSDAKLVTLAVLQALLGFTSERRWIRHARAHLRHLFPYLPMDVAPRTIQNQVPVRSAPWRGVFLPYSCVLNVKESSI